MYSGYLIVNSCQYIFREGIEKIGRALKNLSSLRNINFDFSGFVMKTKWVSLTLFLDVMIQTSFIRRESLILRWKHSVKDSGILFRSKASLSTLACKWILFQSEQIKMLFSWGELSVKNFSSFIQMIKKIFESFGEKLSHKNFCSSKNSKFFSFFHFLLFFFWKIF